MIWRCHGCGARLGGLEEYEAHGVDCIPLRSGVSYRKTKRALARAGIADIADDGGDE